MPVRDHPPGGHPLSINSESNVALRSRGGDGSDDEVDLERYGDQCGDEAEPFSVNHAPGQVDGGDDRADSLPAEHLEIFSAGGLAPASEEPGPGGDDSADDPVAVGEPGKCAEPTISASVANGFPVGPDMTMPRFYRRAGCPPGNASKWEKSGANVTEVMHQSWCNAVFPHASVRNATVVT